MAMANFPSFDPNNYSEYGEKYGLSVFRNDAIGYVFEPGSIFKPLTISMALDVGAVTPNTTYIDEGFLEIDEENTIHNF